MSVRVGITGLGAFHLPLLKWLDETEVIAVCDIEESALAGADVSNKYTDHTRMINSEQLDFVVIATPPSVRVELIEPAAQNDVPILLEKPTALSVETVDTLIQLREEYNVPISATQNVLYFPTVQEAVRRVSNGDIGDVTAVDVVWSERKDLSGAELGQEEWVSEFFGGAISEALPHPCYCGLAFTDELADDISILWRNYIPSQWPDGISIQTRDTANRLISVRFLTRSNEKRRVLIHGEEGELTVDLLRQTVSVDTTDNEAERTIENCPSNGIPDALTGAWTRGHYRLLQEFIGSLRSDDVDVPVSLEQDRDVVRLLELAESTIS